jgi:hypothetical protein
VANNNGDNEEKPQIPSLAEMLSMIAGASTNSPAETEPPSDLRQAALAMRGMHNAFVWAGFTDDQAYGLVIAVFNKGTSD